MIDQDNGTGVRDGAESEARKSANQQLYDFLQDDVRRFIDVAVRRYGSYAPRQLLSLKPLLEESWTEVEKLFEQARRLIADVSLAELREHGLDGAQLQLKIRGVQSFLPQAISRLESEGARLEEAPRNGLRALFSSISRKALARVVKGAAGGINIVLGSLGAVSPLSPITGAISELKGFIEWSAEVTAAGGTT